MWVWHAMWLPHIDTKIAAVRQRETEQQRGRQNRPPAPERIVELCIGAGRPPTAVHSGDCTPRTSNGSPSTATKPAGSWPRE
ncbi:hypothetical protein [Streptomyces sp. NPDC058694]|uniref:hypothetical protein n=1 Tax=Streptomyces sp. NPDC058694 TaxID=3346603 RepID=UPI0036647161